MKLLQALDIFAELIHLVYQLGILTRQYIVPAVVYVYVVLEQGHKQLNSLIDQHMTQEITLQFPHVTKPHPVTI